MRSGSFVLFERNTSQPPNQLSEKLGAALITRTFENDRSTKNVVFTLATSFEADLLRRCLHLSGASLAPTTITGYYAFFLHESEKTMTDVKPVATVHVYIHIVPT